jgi:hypothetical protein
MGLNIKDLGFTKIWNYLPKENPMNYQSHRLCDLRSRFKYLNGMRGSNPGHRFQDGWLEWL